MWKKLKSFTGRVHHVVLTMFVLKFVPHHHHFYGPKPGTMPTPWCFFWENRQNKLGIYMGVSENSGTHKSSILIGFSIINHPFWGTAIFGNPHIIEIAWVSPSHRPHLHSKYLCPTSWTTCATSEIQSEAQLGGTAQLSQVHAHALIVAEWSGILVNSISLYLYQAWTRAGTRKTGHLFDILGTSNFQENLSNLSKANQKGLI